MIFVSGTIEAVDDASNVLSFQDDFVLGTIAALSISGDFDGTVQLQRSLDQGATWSVCSIYGDGTAAEWTSPVSVDFIISARGMLFRLYASIWNSGTAAYQFLWYPPPAPVRAS